jgi:hypothetical protein
MKTTATIAAPATRRNTVETALSDWAVGSFEILLRWLLDNVEHTEFSATLMDVLAVYVEHCPNDAVSTRKPESVVKFISNILQLEDQLNYIMSEEKPRDWVEVSDGWALPVQEATAN